MTLLIFYLCLAIGVSFFCSIAEAVILSVRPSYIAVLEKQGNASALKLKALRENLDRPLSAILTANTIAHTVGAAGVGAQATTVFGDAYLGATSAVLTLLILVFSEIIPKTLGATYWQQLAPTMATLISWLTTLLFPFVWLSQILTRFISRSELSAYTFSRDEMTAMAKIGKEEGLLDIKELKIVTNLMKLRNLSVRDIMTPRPVIFSASEKSSVQEFFKAHSDKPFSRIPVYNKNSLLSP
jgi:CBS domain containing-hemolysin-like protein